MRRLFPQTLSAVLLAALLLAAAGCASMFDREYYVVEEYEVPSEPAEVEEEAADTISSYAALRRAIVRLVSEHAESAQLQFQNYDGSISQDISAACWEVKSTPLGAFAVDYISYDLSRIVSYYQAEIFITYKRAAWQVEAVEAAPTAAALSSRVAESLRQDETYLVLEINSAAVTGDMVRDAAEAAYYTDPLTCPVLPAVETGIFPEAGVSHILEISFDYGLDSEALSQRRTELSEALGAMAETLSEDGNETDEEHLERLCRYLADLFSVAPGAGNTPWDALTQGEADSEGAAMAFEACCRELGFGCVTVAGRLNGEPHFWNIVTTGIGSWHIDLSTWSGETPVFLEIDETMLSRGYWWDNSVYPVCDTSYEPAGDSASGEAAASGEPVE